MPVLNMLMPCTVRLLPIRLGVSGCCRSTTSLASIIMYLRITTHNSSSSRAPDLTSYYALDIGAPQCVVDVLIKFSLTPVLIWIAYCDISMPEPGSHRSVSNLRGLSYYLTSSEIGKLLLLVLKANRGDYCILSLAWNAFTAFNLQVLYQPLPHLPFASNHFTYPHYRLIVTVKRKTLPPPLPPTISRRNKTKIN